MNCERIGELIRQLRLEKGLTQRQLANRLCVSDKAVSKWERGAGCPDVQLLDALSRELGVRMEHLMAGELCANRADEGNLRRLRLFMCPVCGGVTAAAGSAEVGCCGRRLEALRARPAEGDHRPRVETEGEEWYISFSHAMSKAHFLRFVAAVSGDRVLLARLYPEQDAAVRLPRMRGARLLVGCSRDGMFEMKP